MIRKLVTLEDMTESNLLYLKKVPRFVYLFIFLTLFLIIALIFWSINTSKCSVIIVSGKLESNNKAILTSPFSGKISEIRVKEGELIQKDSLLLNLENIDVIAQTNQLLKQIEILDIQNKNYEKLILSINENNNLFSQDETNTNLYYNMYENYTSRQSQNIVDVVQLISFGYSQEQIGIELEKNQSITEALYFSTLSDIEKLISDNMENIEIMNSQLNDLKNIHQQSQIRAPISGLVHWERDIEVGMYVQAASRLASVSVANDSYKVIVLINAADIANVKIGNSAEIEIAGLPKILYGTLTGVIDKIDSDISYVTNSEENSMFYKLELTLNRNHLVGVKKNTVPIRNGMLAKVQIKYDEMSYFQYVLTLIGF